MDNAHTGQDVPSPEGKSLGVTGHRARGIVATKSGPTAATIGEERGRPRGVY